MKMKWRIAGILAAVITAVMVHVVVAAPVVQDSVIAGKVVEVATQGTLVKEGDPILKVETIGGPMVAARATVSGVVEEVSIQVGSEVAVGQEFLIINK